MLTTGLIILIVILMLFHVFGFCAVPRVGRKSSVILLVQFPQHDLFMGCVFLRYEIILDSFITSC